MDFELKDIERLIIEALQEEPTGNDWLDNRYNEQTHLVAHSNPYYKLFYLIAKAFRPAVVVELGGWQGTGAAHFAAGNPEATVITIDHHSDPGDDYNQARMLEAVKQLPNINYVQGWTSAGFVEEYHKGQEGLPRVKEILAGRKIDILFIDSWHEGRYFLRDWETYKPMLADRPLVICDDVLDTELFIDMLAAWEGLPGEKFVNAQVHPGIPMGFIALGDTTGPEPKTTRRKTTKRKSTRKKAGDND